jgi:hypothetical protein
VVISSLHCRRNIIPSKPYITLIHTRHPTYPEQAVYSTMSFPPQLAMLRKDLEGAVERYIANFFGSNYQKTSVECKAFREKLQNASVAGFLEEIREIETNFSNASRFKKLVNRVEPCVKRIQRFSSVIDIVLSSSRLTTPIWGALKFLFQVAFIPYHSGSRCPDNSSAVDERIHRLFRKVHPDDGTDDDLTARFGNKRRPLHRRWKPTCVTCRCL